jgi:thimet oligopeptidase
VLITMLFDYTAVTPTAIETVTREALERADALVAGIEAREAPGALEDVLLPLDQTGRELVFGYGRGAFLARVHPDGEVREAAHAADEKLTKWRVELPFRERLAQVVKEYARTEDAQRLEGERRRLLDHWLRDLRRAGHDLPPEQRAEVQRLRERLVELELAFQRHVDEYQDGVELTREDLRGLPESYIDRLRPGSAPGTYRVTLEYPDFFPFMEQAERRDLRQALEHKQFNQAADRNAEVLAEALTVRRRIAELLGYDSWAHYAQEIRVAREPANVRRLYDAIVPPLTARARDEYERMRQLLEQERPEDADPTLRTWDWRYYDTRLRKHEYGVDQTEVAEYFPLERVMDGMFELTAEVFGLRYRRIEEPHAWHPDVTAYEILDAESGEHVAVFYADLFPREDKYGHAAAFPLIVGHRRPDGVHERPVSAIVANLTKPTADDPSLLKHDEVVTLFHEFGHVLHMSLSRAEFTRFSGAETEWDFVEAPSQIMEHWVWDPDVLARFARHFRTGQPMPRELVDRLVDARNLNEAVKTLRQVYLGQMDLGFHGPERDVDLDEVNRRAFAVTLLPFHEGTAYYCGFEHLMGGYDAGYYGYLWSKVYGDDMYSRFEAEGVTNPEVGRAYREAILERGGTEDGERLLERFLGRPASQDAFLRQLGITPVAAGEGEVR